MNDQDPLLPGQIRFTPATPDTSAPSHSPVGKPTNERRDLRAVILVPALALLFIVVIHSLLQKSAGVSPLAEALVGVSAGKPILVGLRPVPPSTQGVGQFNPSTVPPKTFLLPPKPQRQGGKYAAFLIQTHGTDRKVLVFQWERLQIHTVATVREIPTGDFFRAVHYGQNLRTPVERQTNETDSSGRAQLFAYREEPQVAAAASISGQQLGRNFRAPYILYGNFAIDVGPLVNRDTLVASLISHHGDLKAASIETISGAPRGPPTQSDFDTVRIVYVVGTVTELNGPQMHDSSTLKSFFVDLGPSEAERNRYIQQCERWDHHERKILHGEDISSKDLWSPEAEHGAVITLRDGAKPPPYAQTSPYVRFGSNYAVSAFPPYSDALGTIAKSPHDESPKYDPPKYEPHPYDVPKYEHPAYPHP